jgi:predicted dehydrogenase
MKTEVGFGVVGFGMIAKTHLICMQANLALHPGEPRGYPRALCTRRPDERAGLPFEAVYATLGELLADSSVRVVDICTPNDLHAEAAEAAILAGKAVYVEKPVSHDLSAARRISALAREKNTPNQAALVMRFRPDVNRAKDLILAGEIGEPIHFRACFFHGSYLDPTRPMSWRQSLARAGGGAVMDLGIHMLDLARYLLGDEIEELEARMRTVNKRRYADSARCETVPNETDEYACLSMVTRGGAAGIAEFSRVSASALAEEFFEVFGTKASLLLPLGGKGGALLKKNGAVLAPDSTPGPFEAALSPLLPNNRQSMGFFMDAHAAALQNISRMAAGGGAFAGTPTIEEAVKAQELVAKSLAVAKWS